MNDERTPHSNGHSTDPWESEMSREFDKRVRDLHEAPLSFENVRGKAMTIRRNRRIAVAGGILAAAAVVVPVAVYAGNGLGDPDGDIDPAPATPTISRATDPNQPTPSQPAAGTLGIDYLEGATWHRADGSVVELEAKYDGGTVLGDELLGVRNDNGALAVDVIDEDGTVTESFDTLSYPVANDDNTTVAYVADDGTLMTRWADGEVGMGEGFVDGDRAAAITGGPDCNEVADGCIVYVEHGNGDTPELLDSHGIRDVVMPNALGVDDVSSSGLVAAQTDSTDTGSCSAVFDPAQGANVFETCDASLFDFSPDARHITGSSAYLDGIGMGYVTILDATDGTEVARFTPDQGFVHESVWEDPEHALVNTYDFEQGKWRIYRLGVDGSSEKVLSSSDGDEASPPFILLGGS